MSLSSHQLKRTDITTEVEQGELWEAYGRKRFKSRVEVELFLENSRNPLTTLGDLLRQRQFEARNKVMKYEKRNDIAQQRQENEVLRASYMVQHGPECPCDACGEALDRIYKDAMRTVGVLPKGRAETWSG